MSGGFVHPAQTPYAEAIEMKKALIADFSIPQEAILVDPHARHTTTNMRNAARLLYRYAIPFESVACRPMPVIPSTRRAGDGRSAQGPPSYLLPNPFS